MSEPEQAAEDAPKKKRGLGDTALRFASAGPLVPFILYTMFWGPKWSFIALVLVSVTLAGKEMMTMAVPTSRGLRVFGTLATVGFAAAVRFAPNDATLFGALAAIVVGTLIASLLRPDPIAGAATRAGWLIAGPVYIGGLMATLMLLHEHDSGGAWVLLTMFLSWVSDTTAYFAGRAFGKRKLYPSISPKKSVEGAVGGLFGSVLGAVVLSQTLLPMLPIPDAVGLGIVAGALGQMGDLFASLLKRSTGVKDSGSILPGHGGILDRADALMFTAATTWAYVTWVLPLRG